MKNLNIPMEEERHQDLEYIQNYYSKITGVKFSKIQTLKKLIFETANKIKLEEEKEKKA